MDTFQSHADNYTEHREEEIQFRKQDMAKLVVSVCLVFFGFASVVCRYR